ncbi:MULTISPECIES: ATP-binding protein [unclassified Streptomyces]|uniref:ATP-binding protein n=1 Tax=unclassified Streptomyces TaxID=2593676 RepID=UPI00036730FD|nr:MULTISPECIES: ATP-binding protein [unclassified Streptomyces]MYY00725.1 ATP-binding protein [Streptomyces sp. SID4913]
MTELILILLASAAGAGVSLHFLRRARAEKRRADESQQQREQLAQQLRAAEQFVAYIAQTVVQAAASEAQTGRPYQLDPAVPPQLAHTQLANGLSALANQVRSAITMTSRLAQNAAEEQLAQVWSETERQVAQARQESVDVARAAVRAFASSTVHRAAKLSSTISAGVRRHVSDEAYATLVEMDHLAQQMLLTASGYGVLAGDKLSRRWPATTLTDVVRTAMGRVEGYQRVQHTDLESFAVRSRAVEAVVHALAVLLDNALRYSPPNARVHVSLEHGANAAFLVVDDAGLRMEDERLTWAREVMSGEQRDDITRLGAYPQTGLRVASVLAHQYGFRVELTAPNLYGGTRAIIVLPQELLTTPGPSRPVPAQTVPVARPAAVPPAPLPALLTEPEPEPMTPATPEPVAEPAWARTEEPAPTPEPAPAPEPDPRPGSRPAQTTTASGLTVRRRGERPAAARSGPEPVVEPGRPAVAAAWMAGSRRSRDNQNPPRTDEGR